MSYPKRSKNNTNDSFNPKPPSNIGDPFHSYANGSVANYASSHDNHARLQLHSNNVQGSRPSTEYHGQAGYRERSQERANDLTELERQDKIDMHVDDVHQESYSWHYTCSSNVKILEKTVDAHQYVTSLSEILQVPRTMDGESLIADLHQAIDDGTNEYCREYLMKDEKALKIYVVVGIRSSRGPKREVFYCLQQLADSSIGNVHREGNRLNMKPSIRWFRTKAIERLQGHANVIHASHSLPFNKRDGHFENNTGIDMNSNSGLFGSCRPS